MCNIIYLRNVITGLDVLLVYIDVSCAMRLMHRYIVKHSYVGGHIDGRI